MSNHDYLFALALLTSKGVHDPATMPILYLWTDEASPQLERGVMKWGWFHRAAWTSNNWSFNGAVIGDGEMAGVLGLRATDFAAIRTVTTGSWLGLEHQGHGIGKEMRTAILYFAFERLGALDAHSGAFVDNESSRQVSRALGYQDSGRRTVLRRGIKAELLELRLDRSKWAQREHPAIEISGLEGCREFFTAPHSRGGS